jgi:hypothetical protein
LCTSFRLFYDIAYRDKKLSAVSLCVFVRLHSESVTHQVTGSVLIGEESDRNTLYMFLLCAGKSRHRRLTAA